MAPLSTAILDCGSQRATLVVVQRAPSGAVQIEGRDDQPLTLASQAASQWVQEVAAAAKVLRGRSGWRGAVTLVIPGRWVLTKRVKAPRVDPVRLKKVITFEVRQCLPCALTDVVWDAGVVEETGSETKVLVGAAKRELVESLCAAVESAGFVVRAVLPRGVALVGAVRRQCVGADLPVLAVEIGPEDTTVGFVDRGGYYFRSYPTERGAAKEEAADRVAARLAQEITRSTVAWEVAACQGKVGRILIAGEVAGDRCLRQHLATITGLIVDGIEPPIGADAVRPDEPTLAVVDEALWLGAAEAEFTREFTPLNLLPDARRQAQSSRQRQRWWAVAAALVLLAMMPPWFHLRREGRRLERQITSAESAVGPLRELLARQSHELDRLANLTRQLELVRAVAARRSSWQRLLADLDSRFGKEGSCWIVRMQLLPAGETMSLAPLRVLVSGRIQPLGGLDAADESETAERVGRLLGSIAQSPFVETVEPLQFDRAEPASLSFDFVLVEKGDRPL